MNSEEQAKIIAAARQLKLRDVQLYQCQFDRPTPIQTMSEIKARQETMRHVQFGVGEGYLDGNLHKLLQIRVKLGTRVVADVDAEAPDIYFVIEAEFLVEYEMVDVLDEAGIRAFADFNAVHNVWPFWRQHVYDIVQRARLPHLDIPLYSGVAS